MDLEEKPENEIEALLTINKMDSEEESEEEIEALPTIDKMNSEEIEELYVVMNQSILETFKAPEKLENQSSSIFETVKECEDFEEKKMEKDKKTLKETEEKILKVEKEKDELELQQEELEKKLKFAKIQKMDSTEKQLTEQINQLKKQQGELQEQLFKLKNTVAPIKAVFEEKQKIKQERETLLKSKGQKVSIYYKTLLTQLCAAFNAIYLLQTGYFKTESGPLSNIKDKLSTSSSIIDGLDTGSGFLTLLIQNMSSITDGLGKIAQVLRSGALKVFSSGLAKLGKSVPILGSIIEAGSHVIDEIENVKNIRTVKQANQHLIGFTPKFLDKLAEEIARKLTFLYEEQINLLNKDSVGRFVECGAVRILACLLDSKIEQDTFVESAIAAVSNFEVKQNKITIGFLQKDIQIPLSHQKLKMINEKNTTEDKLYRLTGLYFKSETWKIEYYSNDKTGELKKSNQLENGIETFAHEVGYIETKTKPTTMTLDENKRGPQHPNNNQINNQHNVSTPQEVEPLKNEKQKITQNNVSWKKEAKNLRKENLELKKSVETLEEKVEILEEQAKRTNEFMSIFMNSLIDDNKKMSTHTYNFAEQFMISVHKKLQKSKPSFQEEPQKNNTNAPTSIAKNPNLMVNKKDFTMQPKENMDTLHINENPNSSFNPGN